MVTGDQLAIAVETSKRLGLGTNIMEGKALMAGATLNDELATQVNQVSFLELQLRIVIHAKRSWLLAHVDAVAGSFACLAQYA
jgi:hypothetical protein